MSAIEDQYNFCIKRAEDSPQKCTVRGKEVETAQMVRRTSLKCARMCSDCNAMQCNAMQCNAGKIVWISQLWRLEFGGKGGSWKGVAEAELQNFKFVTN